MPPSVYDIWNVRHHQVMRTRKQKKADIDLYTFKDEAEETSGAHDVDNYWAMLHTFLLSLAIASSDEVQGIQARTHSGATPPSS